MTNEELRALAEAVRKDYGKRCASMEESRARTDALVAYAEVATPERVLALLDRVQTLEEANKRLRTCGHCGEHVDADDAWCGCGVGA